MRSLYYGGVGRLATHKHMSGLITNSISIRPTHNANSMVYSMEIKEVIITQNNG